MSDYTISIPEALYDKAKQLAEQMARPIDEVIRSHLAQALEDVLLALPTDERAELRALAHLSDDTLWTIAREQMAVATQVRMQMLMDKHSAGSLEALEHEELEQLVERGQRLTLRKAEAMQLLMGRGYSIHMDALKAADG
ncbi:MAG: hypothetical protein DYG88_04475 [Chloroflexi bacterium CFX4]|nr:hypothetical protein [Chloroflexi bacterium CFX4]MDL1920974.1 hypothetical protein [Chloroflexi bacterium CFX3]